MLKNYFLTAFRNFARNSGFTFLSLAGLTLGISCVIAIYSFLKLQTSYDKHQSNYEQVYRAVSHWQSGDQDVKFATVPHPLSGGLRSDVPGIEAISNIYMLSAQVNIPLEGDRIKKIKEQNIGFAHQDIFGILDFEWLAGSPAGALADPNSVVISASLAKKYFDINTQFDRAVGKVINIANQHDLVVKGVYADLPKATDFPFGMVAAYDAQEGVNAYFGGGKLWERLNGGTQCIVKINDNADIPSIEAGIQQVLAKNSDLERYSIFLQPLAEVHTTEYGTYSGLSLDASTTRITVSIAILLIVISSINFINISTARAVKRAKEVGIRKVLGGHRSALIFQFLLESFIVVFFAHVISFLMADMLLAWAGELINLPLSVYDVAWLDWAVFGTVSIVFISLLAGLYPAFVLSAFSPLNAIRTKISNIDRQSRFPLRKVLVGSQFAVSIALIMGTLVVIFQLEYFRGHDMGFRKDRIITVVFPQPDVKRQQLLKTELASHPAIDNISLNLGSPLATTNNTSKYYNPDRGEEDTFTANEKSVDENYLEVFKLKLLAGRNLVATDDFYQAVVSETFIRKMGISSPHDAIGKLVHATWGGKMQIVGVVNEFNANSLKEEAMPVILNYSPDYFFEMSVALSSDNAEANTAAITAINEAWEKVYPELLIEYEFFDQRIANQYGFEDVFAKVMRFFAFMAVVICAIGLYGLTDYMANAKRKEIGIRKVVGASVSQILGLFGKEILTILSISFVVAAGITYYVMQQWLETYAHRIDIDWQIVAFSLLLTVGITVFTMGYRSFKAARLNMVDVLKDE